MAFGAISTLYFPVSGSAGSSLWGTDVRKLISSPDAGNDASTKFAMSTNTSAHTVTADPYTSQASDLTEADYGWAIDPTDMNSVSGALRYMPAGNHVATLRIQSTTNTNPNGTVTMFAYRVGPASGRTRTLLGSATLSGITTLDTTIRTYTVTLALSEIVFAADETIQYSFELNGQGVAVTGKNNSFYTGTITGVAVKMDFPLLGTVLEGTGAAAGTGTATGSGATVLTTTGSSAGSATATGSGAAVTTGTGSAQGTATATGQGAAVIGGEGDADGTSTATGVGGSTAAGTGQADGSATVDGVGASVTTGTGEAAGTSDAQGVGASVATGTGSASGTSTASGVGGAVGTGIGTASGDSDVEGIGAAIISGTGSSSGTGTATGVGAEVISGTGSAAGSATVEGVGEAILAVDAPNHVRATITSSTDHATITDHGAKATITSVTRQRAEITS